MTVGPDDDPTAGASWIVLCRSDEVPSGGILAVEHGHRDLVVWRTFDGRPVVCDARCPHQWSHLGADGVVDGDELVCSAHFWRFDVEGRGTKLNVKGRRDPKSDVAVWACREVDGRLEALLDEAPGAPDGTAAGPGEP